MSTKTESPLGQTESDGRLIGNALIAAGERLNSGGSLRDVCRKVGSVARAIYTMPLYLLVACVALSPIYLGLKCMVVTGRVAKWVARFIWWVVSGVPNVVVRLTETIESWMATRVETEN